MRRCAALSGLVSRRRNVRFETRRHTMRYALVISTALVVALSGIAQAGPRLTDRAEQGALLARSALESGQEPADRSVNCYNPYIGDWKHGYPRDDDGC